MATASSVTIVTLLIVSLFASVEAHICIVEPAQRGGYNITGPGEWACFAPVAPCGTNRFWDRTPGAPQIVLQGGTVFNVLLQQNLNHYNPGHPGFLDVAWSVGANQTSDDEFTVLKTFPDYWPYLQGQQTNFTVPIKVPDIDCDHCTLRVRYHPNKPTEPIFHNCADVSIQSSTTSGVRVPSIGGIVAMRQKSHFDHTDRPVLIENGSVRANLTQGHFQIRADVDEQLDDNNMGLDVISQGLVAYDEVMGRIFYLGDSHHSFDSDNTPPHHLVAYDIAKDKWDPPVELAPTDLNVTELNNHGFHWVAIACYNLDSYDDQIMAVAQYSLTAGGVDFVYQRYTVDVKTGVATPQSVTIESDIYVNFFQATYDSSSDRLFVYAGHENTVSEMKSMIYVLESSYSNNATVDVSSYTFQSVTLVNGKLFALSPGLYEDLVPEWTLVNLDYNSGLVYPIGIVANRGEYSRYYGGTIYQVATSDAVLHVLRRRNDNSPVLVEVSISNGAVLGQTNLDVGVNNRFELFNMVYVADETLYN